MMAVFVKLILDLDFVFDFSYMDLVMIFFSFCHNLVGCGNTQWSLSIVVFSIKEVNFKLEFLVSIVFLVLLYLSITFTSLLLGIVIGSLSFHNDHYCLDTCFKLLLQEYTLIMLYFLKKCIIDCVLLLIFFDQLFKLFKFIVLFLIFFRLPFRLELYLNQDIIVNSWVWFLMNWDKNGFV